MNILDIIAKKRDNKELSKQEIEYFIQEYTNGNITDYQAAALIMAIYINGMTNEETKNLTLSMAYSGEVLDLAYIGENIIDKHSTGGVGDKITLILMPIIASLGIPVAKMSGRGLGYTGGTADKLEAIPGYNINISTDDFINNVNKIGISLISQNMSLAPVDKKIYALRDTISCIGSIPLIVSSIMSKKIASGANKLVLDVTVGNGTFMNDLLSAKQLAQAMIDIGRLSEKETVCVLTNMDEPLGKTVGNILEIKETVESLKGNIEPDVKDVVLELGAQMIKLYSKNSNLEENKAVILDSISNGKAYDKFIELVKNQGGDITYLEDLSKFKKANYIYEIKSNIEGYVQKLNAKIIGEVARDLGAGRIRKEDNIDYKAGIVLNKKIGDKVNKGDIIAEIHTNKENIIKEAEARILSAYEINNIPALNKKNILGVMK